MQQRVRGPDYVTYLFGLRDTGHPGSRSDSRSVRTVRAARCLNQAALNHDRLPGRPHAHVLCNLAAACVLCLRSGSTSGPSLRVSMRDLPTAPTTPHPAISPIEALNYNLAAIYV